MKEKLLPHYFKKIGFILGLFIVLIWYITSFNLHNFVQDRVENEKG